MRAILIALLLSTSAQATNMGDLGTGVARLKVCGETYVTTNPTLSTDMLQQASSLAWGVYGDVVNIRAKYVFDRSYSDEHAKLIGMTDIELTNHCDDKWEL